MSTLKGNNGFQNSAANYRGKTRFVSHSKDCIIIVWTEIREKRRHMSLGMLQTEFSKLELKLPEKRLHLYANVARNLYSRNIER